MPAMRRQIDVQTEQRHGYTVIRPRGEIDLHVSNDLRHALLKAVNAGAHVIVDMAGVNYIDSSGIASLIEAFQRARTRDQRFRLAAVPDSAMRVMRIAQLDRVFWIYDTVAAAAGEDA
ncbi:anti-sigma B factor antagonist [Limimonas halophila]|uniref:Anti-sigma factor antagonist n=1 Tax=Limimonas halophila TaxID=1082479 RepID=A0A1G7MG78_9PROT|nr:STAS domain-containing protein [Limimonas halophila]SDF60848.1 anti-sigma B factor antagonist [Limimonas halophila]